ncbi:lipoyl synthase [Thioflexithrix psekupsensis]|uniref:Lipoyl synthase n=1 Tax=Thioflexithrix psekupsensis TaxID=1570016 RepID=A0A251X758_9GAMM|nr:lipoyl synthase [Thioflexithrix psekupsensis]OUD12932.1 lipoyl synthase [Thioflexithrix psekupsensis]
MSKTDSHATHQRGAEKTAKIPIKIQPLVEAPLRKPEWIRIKIPTSHAVQELKTVLRQHKLHTVCEEAACPNLNECFSGGTATFMIMGDICTRRCPFCDVAHGRPEPLNPEEPQQLAETVAAMRLNYVVVTSVDRDDLRDGGAQHFVDCILAIRQETPQTKIEILVPDFRGRLEKALHCFDQTQPDVFNHNLETVPRLYKQARPGADYHWSLNLLQLFKQRHPDILTKSGLMLGLGEEREEIEAVMLDLRQHQCDMLTLGQYLQPSRHHLPVHRYVTPDEFNELAATAEKMGFRNVASGPMVRSSYHADKQTAGDKIR